MAFSNPELKNGVGNDVDLREILSTILNHKVKVLVFSFVITLIFFVYALSIPNSYKSYVLLSPQNSSKNFTGGLSSLASLAGVNIGTSNSKDPFVIMQTTLNDYTFNKYVIEKYNLLDKVNNQENLVFALGINSIYNLFNTKEKNDNPLESKIFNLINSLKGIISISNNNKTLMITLSAELNDRFLAKELVDIYLKELIFKIKAQDMREIDKQIKYYNKELSTTFDVSLKEQLSKSLSSLYQKKVFSQANDFYFVSKVVDSRVSHVNEKTKPKRALIIIVSFISSLVLGIFLIFFIEYIRSNRKDNV